MSLSPVGQEDRLDLGEGAVSKTIFCGLLLPVTQPGRLAWVPRLSVGQPHCGAHTLGLVVCWLVSFSPTTP